LAFCTSGTNLETKAVCSWTPAASQATTIASASAVVVAIGFSVSTCLPYDAASSTRARCCAVGLQTTTASTSSSASSGSASANSSAPKSETIEAAQSGIGS